MYRYDEFDQAFVRQRVAQFLGMHEFGAVDQVQQASQQLARLVQPDKAAFEILEEKFFHRVNVVCINKAVLDQEKTVRLYLSKQRASSDALPPPAWWRYSKEVWYSVSSSVVPEKRGITTDIWEEVETINLSEFILKLGCVVKILKMDIEGAEVAVLRELISANTIGMVRHLFVETHEKQIPEIKKAVNTTKCFASRCAPKLSTS